MQTQSFSIIEEIIIKHKTSGLLIDSNLVYLFVLGFIKPELVEKSSRLSTYSISDFDLLDRFLSNFDKKFITPTVLAEVSNLVNIDFSGTLKDKFFDYLNLFIDSTNELYINIKEYKGIPAFRKLGVTDTNLIKVAEEYNLLLLTDDFPLAGYYRKQFPDSVLNFNNIRYYGW